MAPAAVDELLAGLGADDFDDFEDEVDEKEGGVGTTEEGEFYHNASDYVLTLDTSMMETLPTALTLPHARRPSLHSSCSTTIRDTGCGVFCHSKREVASPTFGGGHVTSNEDCS